MLPVMPNTLGQRDHATTNCDGRGTSVCSQLAPAVRPCYRLAMLIRRPADILSSELTSESTYLSRREFIKGMGVVAAAGVLPSRRRQDAREKLTPFESITTY